MAVKRALVQGPEFVQVVRETEKKVEKLEKNNWDFKHVPEAFAKKDAKADVVAKELVHIHDGQMMTRIGRLIMGGVGTHFNLMGVIPANARLQIVSDEILHEVNRQIGSRGLEELEEYRKLGGIQQVDFYNYGIFYTLRDLVFWLILHDAGCFPSTLEHMARQFVAGNVVQNDMYAPSVPSLNPSRPVFMAGACLMMQFPSTVVQWMEKPLFGGLAKETAHVETLLTLERTEVSHPYLPLVMESKIKHGHQSYYARRFAGVTPKEGVRGPGVPGEQATD